MEHYLLPSLELDRATLTFALIVIRTLRPALVHISKVSQTLEQGAERIAMITPEALLLLAAEGINFGLPTTGKLKTLALVC